MTMSEKENEFLNSKDLYMKINIILFKKFKIITIVLNRKRIEDIIFNRYFKHATIEIKDEIAVVIMNRLKKARDNKIEPLIRKYLFLMPNIDRIKLEVKLGIEDSALTAIVFGIISAFLNVYLRKIPEKHINIKPIFKNYNLLELNLNIVLSITLIRLIRLVNIYRKNMADIKK